MLPRPGGGIRQSREQLAGGDDDYDDNDDDYDDDNDDNDDNDDDNDDDDDDDSPVSRHLPPDVMDGSRCDSDSGVLSVCLQGQCKVRQDKLWPIRSKMDQ